MTLNLSPPDPQVKAGKVAACAIKLGKELCAKGGIDGATLDREIEAFIRDAGCVPALKGYSPPFSNQTYQHSICLSVNYQVVHGVPGGSYLSPEDLVTIDLVVGCDGWYADTARTFTITGDSKKKKVADMSTVVFNSALATIHPNQLIAIYGAYIEMASQYFGMVPITKYCGHAIGSSIHQGPQVLNYSNKNKDIFQIGRSYAVEPVLATNQGYSLTDCEDGWTVIADCLTSHNEDTVFIGENGIINLTGEES